MNIYYVTNKKPIGIINKNTVLENQNKSLHFFEKF